jgi:hypothetical protein
VKRWRAVSAFDEPADAVFGAFDRDLRETGREAQRFVLALAAHAVVISSMPERSSEAIWRLNPEPKGGTIVAISQEVDEEDAARLRAQLRLQKSAALCRVSPSSRVSEPAGHLKGREAWFQRRQKNDG